MTFDEKPSTEGFVNRNIVSKLIKNDIFKRVLEYIGPKYTEDYILIYEDTIMSVSLFRIANSYYHMKECGYYYAKKECEVTLPTSNFKKCKSKKFLINKGLDPFKYLNFLLDKYKKKEIENYLLYKELISIDHYNNLFYSINNNFSYVYSIIEKINKANIYYEQRNNEITKIREKILKKENKIKNK